MNRPHCTGRITLRQWLLGLMLGLVAVLPVRAEPLVMLMDGLRDIHIGPFTEVLEDPSRLLDYQDVSSPKFQQHFADRRQQVLNFGYSLSNFWIRFDMVDHRSSDEPLYLVIPYPLIDEVDLYTATPDGLLQSNNGIVMPASAREVRSRYFVLPLQTSADVTRYHLKVHSTAGYAVPLKVMTESAFNNQYRSELNYFGLYFGIVLAMLLFNGLLFFLVKVNSRAYGYYIATIVVHHVFSQLVLNGLVYEYTGFDAVWLRREALGYSLFVSLLLLIQFSRAFLNTEKRLPEYDRLLRGLMYGGVAMAVVSSLFGYAYVLRMANLFGMATGTLCMLAGVAVIRRGYVAARYYLIAWSLLIVTGSLHALKAWGLLPSNNLTEYGWQVATAAEAVLMALALADQINQSRREAIQAQRQALKYERQAREAEREQLTLQQQANEALEAKVAERTLALELALTELEQANTQLMDVVRRDELTGLLNRRGALERIDQQMGLALPAEDYAVLMCDLDYFKDVNDSHGHDAGDRVLISVAETLKTILRGHDILVRWGGEEFMILLTSMKNDWVIDVAERIRQAVQQNPVVLAGGQRIHTSMSIGIAFGCKQQDVDMTALIAEADQRLYRAKALGRNTVVWRDEEASKMRRGSGHE